MARCFLSYSGAYREVMEVIRRLLHVLEFEVDVFEEPDLERPPEDIFRQRIAAAECMVLLLGPAQREPSNDVAEWPLEEGLFALGARMPIAIILHQGTHVPKLLDHQTAVHFDFWREHSLVENVHHIVKHLVNLKRRIDLPPGNQQFVYRKAVMRYRIQPDVNQVEFYHEVVARQRCDEFQHALDTGMDLRAGAAVVLMQEEMCSVEATLDSGQHRLSLQFGKRSQHEVDYSVRVDPPLQPGEQLGYLRTFTIQNKFPLDRETLLLWAGEPGFPDCYRIQDQVHYGDVYDVVHEMDSILIEFHLPRTVAIRSKRAFAYSQGSERLNELESQRCNAAECLSLTESPDRSERILKLQVRHPLINHRYALLYEL